MSLRWGALVLRPLLKSDEAAWQLVRQRNAAWFGEWDATAPPGHQGEVQKFADLVAMHRRNAKAGQSLPFAMAWDPDYPTGPHDDDRTRLIGQVTVANIVYGSGQFASIGYWIDPAFAGRGLTPASVAIAADYAWQVMGLHRIEIAIRPENARSLRVVEKLGFRHEGQRPRFLHIDGDWRDHDVFALNVEEVPGGLLKRFRQTYPGVPGA